MRSCGIRGRLNPEGFSRFVNFSMQNLQWGMDQASVATVRRLLFVSKRFFIAVLRQLSSTSVLDYRNDTPLFRLSDSLAIPIPTLASIQYPHLIKSSKYVITNDISPAFLEIIRKAEKITDLTIENILEPNSSASDAIVKLLTHYRKTLKRLSVPWNFGTRVRWIGLELEEVIITANGCEAGLSPLNILHVKAHRIRLEGTNIFDCIKPALMVLYDQPDLPDIYELGICMDKIWGDFEYNFFYILMVRITSIQKVNIIIREPQLTAQELRNTHQFQVFQDVLASQRHGLEVDVVKEL
uniref:SMP-LTD domain-containing protein n=1 Tax=Bursaphelenchus xylophilus TaxID=6326 RepID=A0A1I7SVD1_BURXY